jgi:adenylosuccinate synthase
MGCTSVVGLQWGDEAKGKIVDLLTEQHDFVVRYNGGPNAGHTVVSGDKKFKLSLLPTGVLRPKVLAVIGNGVVVYPPRFVEEAECLRAGGIEIGQNLVISNHAHVIFPYHIEEEVASEAGDSAIGTTRRGIGPCYKDKVGRQFAIRLGELLDENHLRRRLEPIVEFKNRLLRSYSIFAKNFTVDGILREFAPAIADMRPHIVDTVQLLHQGLKAGKKILFEGAQGSLLDVDHGTFPYVTSSTSTPAGIWAGSGIPARNLTRVVGVIKAYSTRVGRGPFPTELDDGPTGLGEKIRRTGREYGTVTGRPRRCGWFDAVAVRYSAALAGADELALMLLDVLSDLDEVKIATGYEMDGERVDFFPGDSYLMERCKPIYETLPGWKRDICDLTRLQDFPTNARRYIDRLAEILELPITIVSVGPDRKQTIFR